MIHELGKTAGNPSTNKEGAEVSDQKPFVIRGHHLDVYILLVMGEDPSKLAEAIRMRIERESLDELLLEDHRNSKPETYAKDVLGTGDQADEFEENSRITFETFLRLPDNHPATIVEGIPDAICGGCAAGEHCRKLSNNDYPEEESTFIKDGKHINSFLEKLDKLSLPKPTIVQGQAFFSDAAPQRVRIISTTIGTVKKALKERESEFLVIRR